jgi:coenzyme F420-reducing hydrogenase gamma subunit
MIAVKGCPPEPKDLLNALRQAGIDADSKWFENMDRLPGVFMSRYAGRPEFEEGHFRASE